MSSRFWPSLGAICRLNTLGALLTEQRRTAEAGPPARRALEIREALFGPNHPTSAETLNVLAKVCGKTGRTAEAQDLSARAQRIRAQSELVPNNPK